MLCRRCRDATADEFARGDPWFAEMLLVQALADGVHGMHFQALGQTRLVAEQASQPRAQRVCQGFGERGQQHPAVGVAAREEHSAMQRHDGLARARLRMRFQPAPPGPVVSFVVMIDVAKQQTARRFVHDQADVGADAHGPEILVLGLPDHFPIL